MTTVFQGGLASIIKENPSLTWPVRDGFLFLFVKPTHLVGGCLSIPILAHTSIFYKKILAIFYAVFCFMAKTYISIWPNVACPAKVWQLVCNIQRIYFSFSVTHYLFSSLINLKVVIGSSFKKSLKHSTTSL